MPQGGKAVFLNWFCSTASTCTISLIGNVSGTLLSINVVSGTSGSVTGLASFVANEFLNVQVTSGTATNVSKVFWIIRFD
jgi:hypothetical protein